MTTIFENKAQQVYAELEEMQKNAELLGIKKAQFESQAKTAREDEAKAKQSVSRAHISGDEALVDAFRKTAKQKGELAEELESTAKEADAAIAEAKNAVYFKKQDAGSAGRLARKEHSVGEMRKILPVLTQLIEMLTEHDREQARQRAGDDRYSTYAHLFDWMSDWFHISKGSDPSYVLTKFGEELQSATKILDDAVAAGFVGLANEPSQSRQPNQEASIQQEALARQAAPATQEPPKQQLSEKQLRRNERTRNLTAAVTIADGFRY